MKAQALKSLAPGTANPSPLAADWPCHFLGFLGTVERYRSLKYGFHVMHNTSSSIVHKCCDAIFEEYSNEVMHWPRTRDQ